MTNITDLLVASLFKESINSENLREAALRANSIIQSVLQEPSIDLQERYKVFLKA